MLVGYARVSTIDQNPELQLEKPPKLSEKQQKELGRMHATGEYSISDLAEVFAVSRPTVYRTLNRIQVA